MKSHPYDAILVMSFGGPEGPDDVMPFLDNVLRGKNVPEERKREVAHHYDEFGGVSPINQQNRNLIAALHKELAAQGVDLPIYWGNRNWTPYVTDTIREMRDKGVKRMLTLVTSGFSCYSGCRQYREDIEKARQAVGPDAPVSDKVRVWFNHPLFIETWCDTIKAAAAKVPAGSPVAFTAHSIPMAMADKSQYVAQLTDACHLIAERLNLADWKLVYQSRSGPPHQPWLEPDIGDHIRELHAKGVPGIVIAPLGFISDHMEVLYDLDHEAKDLCAELGLPMARAATPGVHPLFVKMLVELLRERMDPTLPKRTLGSRGPKDDVCPPNCCLSGRPEGAPAGHGHGGRVE